MSSLKIEERFSVHAPVERVWRFLLDPEQIAPCLPGAELLQIENERTFHGQMKVKVGPVTVAYQGTIELTSVDEAGRRVQMVGKGKEKGGAGSAKMTMASQLEPQPDGAVAIAVTSDVELAGRIVRFGRGMIQSVSAQLFKQFAVNVRQALEGDGAGETAGTAPEAAEAGDAGGAAEAVTEPAAAAGQDSPAPQGHAGAAARESEAAAEAAPAVAPDAPATPAVADAAEPGTGAAPAGARAPETMPAPASEPAPHESTSAPGATAPASTPSAAPEAAAASRAAQGPQARTGRELAPRTAEPVRALPLLFRALWDVITGFFKRLLGRSR